MPRPKDYPAAATPLPAGLVLLADGPAGVQTVTPSQVTAPADAALAAGLATRAMESHKHGVVDVLTLSATLDGKQPLDDDLTAIAGLAGTGSLRRTGSAAWVLDGGGDIGTVTTWSNGYLWVDRTAALVGQRGNPARPFPTIALATAAAVAGDVLILSNDWHLAPGLTTQAGLTFRGVRCPGYDSEATPTTLVQGTVVRGPWEWRASGLAVSDVGIDCGPAVCAASFAGVAQEGLFVNPAAGSLSDFRFDRLTVLCQSQAAAVHGLRTEGDVRRVTVTDLLTCYGQHGYAIKCRDVFARRLTGRNHSQDCVVVKADAGQVTTNVLVADVSAKDLPASASAVILAPFGGVIDLIRVSGVVSAGTGVTALGNSAGGRWDVRDVSSEGGAGGYVDNRGDFAAATLDSLSLTGVRSHNPGTAGVQIGTRCQRFRVRDVEQTGSGAWGMMLFGVLGTIGDIDVANTLFVWPGSMAAPYGYLPRVQAATGSLVLRGGLNDTGSRLFRTDGP